MTLDGIDCKDIYFGHILRRIRIKKRRTLKVLGDFIGYSTSNIQRWEANTSFPSNLQVVELISEILQCTQSEQLELEEAYLCTILRHRGLCE